MYPGMLNANFQKFFKEMKNKREMNPQSSSLLEFLKDIHKDEQAENKSLKYNELTGSKENDTPGEVLSNFSMIVIPQEEVPKQNRARSCMFIACKPEKNDWHS